MRLKGVEDLKYFRTEDGINYLNLNACFIFYTVMFSFGVKR